MNKKFLSIYGGFAIDRFRPKKMGSKSRSKIKGKRKNFP